MAFIDVREAARRWNMLERRVTFLCRDHKIIGAKKEGKFWYVPDDAPRPADGRTKEARNGLRSDGAGGFSEICDTSRHTVVYAYECTYQKTPTDTVFTPYRISPLGAHVDHNLGKITGMAIDKGIHMAFGPKANGVIEVRSMQFERRVQWHVCAVMEEKQNDWADYLRGATLALGSYYPLRVGLSAVIDGELPIGGLSASSAVIITFLMALSKVNSITLSKEEIINLALKAENKYVGVSCGRMDQSCALYCLKDHLLYMDTLDNSKEIIPANEAMAPYKIALFYSGIQFDSVGSRYNMRVDEARAAAYNLKAYAGIPYGKIESTALRDVPYEVFLQYKDRLPENFAKRATHFYGEMQRVEEGAAAWRRGDIATFGRLTFESGRSVIENWQTGSMELIALYNLMRNTDGIYGGCFSGAGFRGFVMALIDPSYEESILENLRRKYISTFPDLRDKYSAYICGSADGVIM